MTIQRTLLLGRIAIVLALLGFMTSAAQAGNDPSIKGDLRTNVHQAMNDFVAKNTIGGVLSIYDPVDGVLLKLGSYELHDGIVKKGDFYVSCADFVDQKGRKIDVDFLVLPNGGKLQTAQGIVHSVSGKKRKYHLE